MAACSRCTARLHLATSRGEDRRGAEGRLFGHVGGTCRRAALLRCMRPPKARDGSSRCAVAEVEGGARAISERGGQAGHDMSPLLTRAEGARRGLWSETESLRCLWLCFDCAVRGARLMPSWPARRPRPRLPSRVREYRVARDAARRDGVCLARCMARCALTAVTLSVVSASPGTPPFSGGCTWAGGR